ncbi:Cerevisin [Dactylellina cionopaga]|nr:Cerevisin [Dactylellina cionopaga]
MYTFTPRLILSTLFLLTTISASPIPHDGPHDSPSTTLNTTTDHSLPYGHPKTYSHYMFRFPYSPNRTKVNTTELLASLTPHGFNMSHLRHTYSETLNGFSAHMSDHCVGILKDMVTPEGVIIEPVIRYKLQAPIPNGTPPSSIQPPNKSKTAPTLNPPFLNLPPNRSKTTPNLNPPAAAAVDEKDTRKTQTHATWGLQRISQREPIPLSSADKASSPSFLYSFDEEGGEGVDIYILDTGVNIEHKDFGGRATLDFSAGKLGTKDSVGHGTHCAGTTASAHYGVAKKATIHAMKVMGMQGGDSSDIAAGIEAMLTRHKSRRNDPSFRGSVASMSFGLDIPETALNGNSTSTSAILEKAIMVANAAGIHTVIAAGNQGIDACRTSPALLSRTFKPEYNYSASVITVGATDITDNRADFSNYGKCVTTYAPGVSILSTYIGSDNATMVMQGTSMAAPHISGMVAYLLSVNRDLKEDVVGMKKMVMNLANKQVVGNVRDIKDTRLLAYNGVRG